MVMCSFINPGFPSLFSISPSPTSPGIQMISSLSPTQRPPQPQKLSSSMAPTTFTACLPLMSFLCASTLGADSFHPEEYFHMEEGSLRKKTTLKPLDWSHWEHSCKPQEGPEVPVRQPELGEHSLQVSTLAEDGGWRTVVSPDLPPLAICVTSSS